MKPSEQNEELDWDNEVSPIVKPKRTSLYITPLVEEAFLREGARNGKYTLQGSLQVCAGTLMAYEELRPLYEQNRAQQEILEEVAKDQKHLLELQKKILEELKKGRDSGADD